MIHSDIVIPQEILKKNSLNAGQKIIFGVIYSNYLYTKNNCFVYSNEELGEIVKMCSPTVSKAIYQLIKLGYLRSKKFNGIKYYLELSDNFIIKNNLTFRKTELL